MAVDTSTAHASSATPSATSARNTPSSAVQASTPYANATGKRHAANTASRDSQEVRNRENERQAFAGLARCSTDEARPAATSANATAMPCISASDGSA